MKQMASQMRWAVVDMDRAVRYLVTLPVVERPVSAGPGAWPLEVHLDRRLLRRPPGQLVVAALV
ncbi:MAG TPA: hypothetical protein VNL95_00680 [Dehalococcoidia bacterium]|nr:hypothetical protein [Dehalococcoidia bacterium]